VALRTFGLDDRHPRAAHDAPPARSLVDRVPGPPAVRDLINQMRPGERPSVDGPEPIPPDPFDERVLAAVDLRGQNPFEREPAGRRASNCVCAPGRIVRLRWIVPLSWFAWAETAGAAMASAAQLRKLSGAI